MQSVCSTAPRLNPRNQMVWCHIQNTRLVSYPEHTLPLSRDAVCVFYCPTIEPSQSDGLVSYPEHTFSVISRTHVWCHIQNTRYPSAEMQSVCSTAPRLNPRNQMVWCHIQNTRLVSYPEHTFGVISRTHVTPQQRCSLCVLLPHD